MTRAKASAVNAADWSAKVESELWRQKKRGRASFDCPLPFGIWRTTKDFYATGVILSNTCSSDLAVQDFVLFLERNRLERRSVQRSLFVGLLGSPAFAMSESEFIARCVDVYPVAFFEFSAENFNCQRILD